MGRIRRFVDCAARHAVAVALGAPAIPHFSVPVLPAFALLLAGVLLGPRRSLTYAE